ncbi:uncharacterized protein TRAVEDRAFT_71452, partial [Trametes versicolor FP-101664 SS1]|uniref:uncharacterized protein n=1 Tax=Trametes versicolor (strain FP-101664) TaxID=717944 RepID=UPI0004623517
RTPLPAPVPLLRPAPISSHADLLPLHPLPRRHARGRAHRRAGIPSARARRASRPVHHRRRLVIGSPDPVCRFVRTIFLSTLKCTHHPAVRAGLCLHSLNSPHTPPRRTLRRAARPPRSRPVPASASTPHLYIQSAYSSPAPRALPPGP